MLQSVALLGSNDEIIREGVRAMLAQWHEDAEQRAVERQQKGWTSFQIADHIVLQKLRAASGNWSEYTNREKREAALKRFHEYAYQWY